MPVAFRLLPFSTPPPLLCMSLQREGGPRTSDTHPIRIRYVSDTDGAYEGEQSDRVEDKDNEMHDGCMDTLLALEIESEENND